VKFVPYPVEQEGTRLISVEGSSTSEGDPRIGVGDPQITTAAERVRIWSEELFRELLPVQDEPGVPVLLACDDETVRVVADRLGFVRPDPGMGFASDVRIAFKVGKYAGWTMVTAGDWEKAPRPRPLPPFFPVLCLWVLAATRMAPDERHATNEYHGRLCDLLGIDAEDALPCFEFIGPRFADLADWLEQDLGRRHGRLIVPDNPWPKHVAYAVAQTVFRLRDRQVLSTFFADRLQGSLDGFDPLRRLQRWAGRGALTRHALKLVEGEEFADRVRGAIRVAFRSWDGAELIETERGVGRFWPALLRLVMYPQPHLQVGARNLKPLELVVEGEQRTLEPGRELDLPWALLDRLRARSVDLGDPRSSPGGLRLPRLGETVIFEDGDEGLLRAERPAAETVWVLTRDTLLQEPLQRRRFNHGGLLPAAWALFFDVPVAALPGVERSSVAMPEQTPLRIEGGLSLGHPRFLSGHPPSLVAGDLETDDALPVMVNAGLCGHIRSDGRLTLPAEPGRYELVVGDGYFRASYDVEECGEPRRTPLRHHLASEQALRTGARPGPADDSDGVTVSGGTVSPPYQGPVPTLTRVSCDVEIIDGRGELELHRRPPTPAWFTEIGLDERGRWELFSDDAVWLLMPSAGGPRRVRLLADHSVARLSLASAGRVAALGTNVAVLKGGVGVDESRRRWSELLSLAEQELSVGGVTAR